MDTSIYIKREDSLDKYLVEYIEDHTVVRKRFATLGEVLRLVYFLLLIGHTVNADQLKQMEEQYFKIETA